MAQVFAERLRPGDAVVAVDVQVDFCPGGALPIAGGDEVVPVLNAWLAAAAAKGLPVYASRDWHPERHLSFREEGGPWPRHCVEGTPGAAFRPDLRLPAGTIVVSKGVRLDREQYSAFHETGLAHDLRKRGVRRVWLGGLALDVCVRATALDGVEEGFEVRLLRSATRPVTPEGGAEAIEEMRAAGVAIEG